MVVRSKPRSTRLLLVVLVSLSLAVITVDYRQGPDGPLAGLGRTSLSLMAPLQRAVTNATRPVGDFFVSIAHLPSLSRENRDLKEEVAGMRTDINGRTALESELNRLRQLLDLTNSTEFPLVNALVIGNGVSNFENVITIDRGYADGIAVDMPVVTGGDTGARLVGRVIAVASNAANVMLITDRDAATAARLVDTRQAGLLEGQGDADMVMSFLKEDVAVEPGAVVETNGYENGLYPPGITIGEVSRFVPATSTTELYVTVRPAVDFSTLDYVAVVLKPAIDTSALGGGQP
ncbi:MAG: rod shape-determining protein MreC [Actinomycetota bacterium]|nr:rod shape-determining protein MreC [Actinomycetota bacterium]